ncbi:MAG: PepSY-associated TM helix domain-containing protein [Bacteroidota bacterium]|nr:PepSY-associated TM helix domain-containing protein [Bacteroidota bacterium]
MIKKLIRKIHFYLSLFLYVQVLLYLLTGLMFGVHSFMPNSEKEWNAKMEFYKISNKIDTSNKEKSGLELQRKYAIKGRMMNAKLEKENLFKYDFNNPLENVEVSYIIDKDSVILARSTPATFFKQTERIHVLHNYKGKWFHLVWATMLDVTAVSMILFSITGMILWYDMRKKFGLGWYFLIVSWAITIYTIISLVI